MGEMQHLQPGPPGEVTTFGAQVDLLSTMVGTHVEITTGGSETTRSSVDTDVETMLLEMSDVPSRVAVGVDWQAIRTYS